MTVDIEAGGAFATAALTAKVIEGQSGADMGHSANCANCKAQLIGSYCHACGQIGHVHRSIWHMLEEGLHGLLHFDSKTWRTLPLLIGRPGLLTRRYIDGQRVRYVSPLALFLFTIFLMFFVLSFANSGATKVAGEERARPDKKLFLTNGAKGIAGLAASDRTSARLGLVAELDDANANLAQQAQRLASAKNDDDREDATAELAEAQTEQRAAAAALSLFDKLVAADARSTKIAVTIEEIKALPRIDFAGANLKWLDILKHLAENPDFILYKFKNTAYKFSFMLVPISLPFFWLMFFWKREVTTYDHMVFSMYSLSFMSLLFVVMVLMSMTVFTSRLTSYLLWLPPLHMFMQLKEAYGLTLFSTLWRTFALLASAAAVFSVFIAMIAAITAL